MNAEGKIVSGNSSGRGSSGKGRQPLPPPPPPPQQRLLLLPPPPPPSQQRFLLLPPPPKPSDMNEEVASNVVDEASRRRGGGGEKGEEEQTSMKKQKKKRGRPAGEASGVGPSGTKPKFDAPEVATPCSVCGKQFRSWKALFGHMRSHPERTWRGVNPPPTFTAQPSPNAPAEAQLLTLNAGRVYNRMEAEAVDPPTRHRRRRRLLEFDLNCLPENQNGHSGSSGGSAAVHGFDLNRLPENSGAED